VVQLVAELCCKPEGLTEYFQPQNVTAQRTSVSAERIGHVVSVMNRLRPLEH
jgi:hypothetical protein